SERCVAGASVSSPVCQLPEQTHCLKNSDCVGAQLCGPDGMCRDRCVSSMDCVYGQLCVSDVCAEPREIASGMLPGADGGASDGAIDATAGEGGAPNDAGPDVSIAPDASDAGDASVPSFGSAVSVAAGLAHTCALMKSGSVVCWGANESGEL